ncbi:hypothetical protein [Alteripontixanthobacter maritimus]|nr:hypothetical protein [Alteripontixanthobacter maritimus]
MRFQKPLLLFPLFSLACCTSPAPAPTPAPPVAAPAPIPAPVVTPPVAAAPNSTDWMDAPLTAGDWSYASGSSLTRATFGPPGGNALFGIECLRGSGQMRLVRSGGSTQDISIRVRTESAERLLTAQPDAGGGPFVAAFLNARDPLLDAMAFSKGRFAIGAQGRDTLYVPAYPEVTRVIEDCR